MLLPDIFTDKIIYGAYSLKGFDICGAACIDILSFCHSIFPAYYHIIWFTIKACNCIQSNRLPE